MFTFLFFEITIVIMLHLIDKRCFTICFFFICHIWSILRNEDIYIQTILNIFILRVLSHGWWNGRAAYTLECPKIHKILSLFDKYIYKYSIHEHVITKWRLLVTLPVSHFDYDAIKAWITLEQRHFLRVSLFARIQINYRYHKQ